MPKDVQQVDIKHKKYQLGHGKRVEGLEFCKMKCYERCCHAAALDSKPMRAPSKEGCE